MKKSKKNAKAKPYNVQADDMIMKCPYDVVHYVRARKMVGHLVRCRRNWVAQHEHAREVPLILTCRYNSFHRVPAPEIMFHEKICRDRSCTTAYLIEFTTQDCKRHHLYTTIGQPFTEMQAELTPQEGKEGNIVMRLSSELDTNVVAMSSVLMAFDQLQLFPFRKMNMEEERELWNDNNSLQGTSHNLFGFDRAMASIENEAPETKPDIEMDENWENEKRPKYLPFDAMKGFKTELLLKYPGNLSRKDRKQWKTTNVTKAQDMYGGSIGNVEPIFDPLLFARNYPLRPMIEEQSEEQEQPILALMEEEESIQIPPTATDEETDDEEETKPPPTEEEEAASQIHLFMATTEAPMNESEDINVPKTSEEMLILNLRQKIERYEANLRSSGQIDNTSSPFTDFLRLNPTASDVILQAMGNSLPLEIIDEADETASQVSYHA